MLFLFRIRCVVLGKLFSFLEVGLRIFFLYEVCEKEMRLRMFKCLVLYLVFREFRFVFGFDVSFVNVFL